MDVDGRFVPEQMERLCGALYPCGIDGLYVCGQTGEGLQQPIEQRKRVVEVAVKSSPSGKNVMAHIGAASTEDAIALARHAEKIGAASLSALPPAGGSFAMDEVAGYYAAIAASTGLPLFVYFFPAFSTRPGSYDDLKRLIEIPNVAGLKFTSTDLFTMWKLKRDGAIVFNGFDEILVAGLAMGADGGIGTFYNVVPEWFVAIRKLASEGKWDEARTVQSKVNALIELALRYPGHAAAKAMLEWQGLPCGPVRGPRANLTPAQKTELFGALDSMEMPRR